MRNLSALKIGVFDFLPVLLVTCVRENKSQTAANAAVKSGSNFSGETHEIDGNASAFAATQAQENLNRIMFVNMQNGLRIRNSPSVNSEKIGGSVRWVYIISPIQEWGFDGFLETDGPHLDISEMDFWSEMVGVWATINSLTKL